ncbi:MAG: hypothetical protein OXJ54_11835 [Gemmatimonadetes bacterium]|nr:hypothetical protein [Candidatus Palauibacter rhopaloidicola]
MRRFGTSAPHLLAFGVVCGTALMVSQVDHVVGQTPTWSLRRTVTIGSLDDPAQVLTVVADVLTDAERVYVLEPRDGRIRVFSRNGKAIRDLGGRGEGPGELTLPVSMGWHGARLWVADHRLMRFTFFDVETGDAETIPYRADFQGEYYSRGMSPSAVLATGDLVGYATVSARALAAGVVADRAMIVTDTGGAVRDTLALLSVVGQSAEITDGLAGGAMYTMSPLPDTDMMDFRPDGSSAVLVRRRSWDGSGPAEFEVSRIDIFGDTVFRRRIAYEPRMVPDDLIDREIDRRLGRRGVVDRRAFGRALRAFYEQQRYMPPVTSLTTGDDGTVWVAGPDDDGERWWQVLDASGSSVGRFRLPVTSRVASANLTEAWVVERDALDIPYVVRYEIVP